MYNNYLVIFVLTLLSINCNKGIIESNTYDIKIKIRGKGKQKIISSINCPKEIYYINGTLIGNNLCEIELEKEENIIIMKWDNKISGQELFRDLTNILEVDLSNLKYIVGRNGMLEMFNGCTSLTSIDFSNLNTSSVSYSLARIFKNCYSLKTIDLSKLDISHIPYLDNIFQGCKSLEYINYINYMESKVELDYYTSIDDDLPNNLVICISQTNAPNLYNSVLNRGCTIIDCDKNWREKQKKIIAATNVCVSACENENIYEFENKCYESCPNGTKSNNFICEKEEIIIVEETETNSEFSLITSVTSNNIISHSISTYLINMKEETKTKGDQINKIQKAIQEGILDSVLKNITENKEDFIEKVDDMVYQITTSENQKMISNRNISSVNLGECENILKKVYNINESLPLIIFKVDYYLEDILIPIIGYEIYHPLNKSKLDLIYCEDELIKLNIPVIIDENNIFKYNPNSDYYNDNCFSYTTENGTDIILNDRRQEFINNNLSLCENNCSFTGYEKETKKSSCNCYIKKK